MRTWQAVGLIALLAAALAGWIGLLVTAFRSGLAWGLCSLLVPLVGLVFAIVHWREVWPSFVFNIVGGLGSAAMILWVVPPGWA
jgi:spore maturation protein SpmA